MSRRKRVGFWLRWCLLLVPTVCLVGGLLSARHLRLSLQAELAEMRSLGIPLEPEDLARNVPAEENAEPMYRKAFVAVRALEDPVSSESVAIRNVLATKATPEDRARAERFLLQAAEALTATRQALSKPYADFGLDYGKGWDYTSSESRQMYRLVDLLLVEATFLRESGAKREALTSLSDALGVSRHLLQEKNVDFVYLGARAESRALEVLRHFLSGSPDLDLLHAIDSIVERLPAPPRAADTLPSQIVLSRTQVRTMRRFMDAQGHCRFPLLDPLPETLENWTLDAEWFTDGAELQTLRTARRLLSELPAEGEDWRGYEDTYTAISDEIGWSRSPFCAPVSFTLFGGRGLGRVLAGLKTERRLTRAAAQTLIRSHGSEPPSALPDLGELAIDPFSDKPFRYRKLKDGFVIYSIGSNGEDDLGVSRRDIVATIR